MWRASSRANSIARESAERSMRCKQVVQIGCVIVAGLLADSTGVSRAQDGISHWRLDARKSLLGVWERHEAGSNPYAIPRFKIWMESGDASPKIQFSGRDGSDDLHILPRPGAADPRASVVAFSLHRIGSDLVHVTLKLNGDDLLLKGAKIVNDSSEDIDRFFGATYSRTRVFSMPVASTRRNANVDFTGGVPGTSRQFAYGNAIKRQVRVGRISGKIDTRSTLRGTIRLTPYPKQVRPRDGIKVGAARPQFGFSNVPEGVYTLTFQGTVNGTSKTLSWKGLRIDISGGKPSLSLKLR